MILEETEDGFYAAEDQEEDIEPDFYTCMCCSNVQQSWIQCNKCCGPVTEGWY